LIWLGREFLDDTLDVTISMLEAMPEEARIKVLELTQDRGLIWKKN